MNLENVEEITTSEVLLAPVNMWSAQPTKRFARSKDCRLNTHEIYSVTYGVVFVDGRPKSVKCFMRDDTLRCLRDNTFTLLRGDNAAGILVVDRVTHLLTPYIDTGKDIIF